MAAKRPAGKPAPPGQAVVNRATKAAFGSLRELAKLWKQYQGEPDHSSAFAQSVGASIDAEFRTAATWVSIARTARRTLA